MVIKIAKVVVVACLVAGSFYIGKANAPQSPKPERLAFILGYEDGVYDSFTQLGATPSEVAPLVCPHLRSIKIKISELPGFDADHRLSNFTQEMENFCANPNDPSINAPSSDDNPDSPVTQN